MARYYRGRIYKPGDLASHEDWCGEELGKLVEEFAESRILRLASTKPAKIIDQRQAKQILGDIKKFRYFARPTGEQVLCFGFLTKIDKKGKGWQVVYNTDSLKFPCVYITTRSKIAKLDLLIEDLEERIIQLEEAEKKAAEDLKRSRDAAKHFEQVGQDEKLAGALWHALETTPPTGGFIYFKRWTMPDSSCWFKVGVTNNPERRETEQNVLPVAAETIVCVDVGSMDRARAVEAVVHQVLEEQRITDANNRELFHLSDQQAAAVKAVLEKLV
jgi:hypothetical protein